MSRGADSTARQKVLVTGANGYLGGWCARALSTHGFDVRRGVRKLSTQPPSAEWVEIGDLAEAAERGRAGEAIKGCQIVVHCAGASDVPEDPQRASSAIRSNVIGSAKLASTCASLGVRRFVFVSSALVLAGSRDEEGRVRDTSPVHPLTTYAKSKADAEKHVCELASRSRMEWIILRPPMIYGPASPGNFHRLARLVNTGLPLPFGRATAMRSILYVENFVAALVATMSQSLANEAWLVSDPELTSTSQLVAMIATSLRRPERQLSIPVPLCLTLAKTMRRATEAEKLFAPFIVNAQRFSQQTGWHAPVTQAEGIARSLAGQTRLNLN